MQLCTPAAEADSSAAPSGTALPATGVLIDTLKHLNPGVKTFRYPDAKKPGRFKERLPYTAWSPMRNIRCVWLARARLDTWVALCAGAPWWVSCVLLCATSGCTHTRACVLNGGGSGWPRSS